MSESDIEYALRRYRERADSKSAAHVENAALIELAQLRLRAAEADALRAERDTWRDRCSDFIEHNCEQAEAIETLRAESQRRLEDLQAAEKKYTELRATVAAQAQTIESARDAIDKLVMRIKKFVDDNELDLWDAETLPEIISARAWLAANAPTPTTGETESEK